MASQLAVQETPADGDTAKLRESWSSLSADLVEQLLALRKALADEDKDGKQKLDVASVQGAIEKAKIARVQPDMMKIAIECGDTDGSGENIVYGRVVSKLADLLIEEDQAEVRATADKVIAEKSAELKDALDAKSVDGIVTCGTLKTILAAAPFSLGTEGERAVLRSLGLKDEKDKITVLKVLYKYAKGTHEDLLSGIRRRIVDKFTSLKVAFRNISKGTAAIKVADLRGVVEDLDPTISKADLSRVRAPHPPRVLPARLSQPPRPPASPRALRPARLTAERLHTLPRDGEGSARHAAQVMDIADADRSGAIDFSEFSVVFGHSMQALQERQRNFEALSERAKSQRDVVVDSDPWAALEARLITALKSRAPPARQPLPPCRLCCCGCCRCCCCCRLASSTL